MKKQRKNPRLRLITYAAGPAKDKAARRDRPRVHGDTPWKSDPNGFDLLVECRELFTMTELRLLLLAIGRRERGLEDTHVTREEIEQRMGLSLEQFLTALERLVEDEVVDVSLHIRLKDTLATAEDETDADYWSGIEKRVLISSP